MVPAAQSLVLSRSFPGIADVDCVFRVVSQNPPASFSHDSTNHDVFTASSINGTAAAPRRNDFERETIDTPEADSVKVWKWVDKLSIAVTHDDAVRALTALISLSMPANGRLL
jgi:hypothetical protein